MKTMLQQLIICAFLGLAAGCDDKAKLPTPSDNDRLRLGSSEKLVSNKAGSFDVYVTSNKEWTVEPLVDWLEPSVTAGSGNETVKVNYDASDLTKRSGVVRFTAEGLNPVDLLVTQTEATFSNPIFQMPDPWVIRHETAPGNVVYYACKAQGNGINMSRSDRLSVITGTSSVFTFPSSSSSAWNVANVWAPELHYVDGAWYVYYAAGRPTSESGGSYDKQRTGVLRNRNADPLSKNWEDMGMIYTGDSYSPGIKPTVDNTVYAIDMGVFKLNGQLYAVWSGNASKTSGDQYLFIAKMDNPYTISSSRVEISRPEKSWELQSGKVNEGPAVLINEAAGKVFIVYSCNGSWTNKYRLGMLTLDMDDDPMVKSNWVKSANEVFYRFDNTPDGTNGVNGLGHNCFTKSPDGTEDWIVYHVNHSRDSGWDGRQAFIQPFTWNADGTPNFGTPAGWGENIPIPAGETPKK